MGNWNFPVVEKEVVVIKGYENSFFFVCHYCYFCI